MAVLVTNPQLHLENGEATAFEIVAHTFDYVCQSLNPEKNNKEVCKTCPFNYFCDDLAYGYDIANELRRIAKECKSK